MFLEMLETRRLLSASLTDSGQLVVMGDQEAPNSITVGLSTDGSSVDVTVNDATVQAFDSSAVSSLVIIGGNGDDVIKIDETNGALAIPTKIFGGSGNDYITSGAGKTFIDGGAGADTILAGSGNSKIVGGGGADSIVAGSGNDVVYGNKGKDSLDGGSGSDTLAGGKGGDDLHAGSGNDFLSGGKGPDVLSGGDGSDTLIGGKGSDQFNGGSGHCDVIGGAGHNQVNVGDGDLTLGGNADRDQVNNTGSGTCTHGDVTPPVIPAQPNQTAPTDTPVATAVGAITGTVTDSSGNPVASATVVLCTTEGDAGGYTIANSFGTGTDANGNFTLSDVPAGTYVVLAGRHGVGIAHTTVTVTDGTTTNVSLPLQAPQNPGDGNGSLSGNVMDSQSNPISGAQIMLVSSSSSGVGSDSGDSGSPGTIYKATSNSSGNFAFTSLPAGSYVLIVVDQGVGFSQSNVTITRQQTATTQVTIQTSSPTITNGGTVSGAIVDTNTDPVANCSVGLVNTATGQVFGGHCDGSGNYTIVAPAGTYTLMAGLHGVGRASVTNVVVTEGGTVTENLTLTQPNPEPSPSPTPTPDPSTAGSITGVIEDSGGNPVAGASVGTSMNGQQYITQTDNSGNYTLNVAAGDYHLSAGKDGVGSISVNDVAVTAGNATEEDLTLAAPPTPTPPPAPTPAPANGMVSGVITDSMGNPVAGASVALVLNKHEIFGTTDANGNYSLSAPPATYTLYAGVSGLGYANANSVAVTSDTTVTENLMLHAPTGD